MTCKTRLVVVLSISLLFCSSSEKSLRHHAQWLGAAKGLTANFFYLIAFLLLASEFNINPTQAVAAAVDVMGAPSGLIRKLRTSAEQTLRTCGVFVFVYQSHACKDAPIVWCILCFLCDGGIKIARAFLMPASGVLIGKLKIRAMKLHLVFSSIPGTQ